MQDGKKASGMAIFPHYISGGQDDLWQHAELLFVLLYGQIQLMICVLRIFAKWHENACSNGQAKI